MRIFLPEVQEASLLQRLQRIADVKVGEKGRYYSEDDLAKEMADVDVVIITSQHRITKKVIENAPMLRAIVKCGSAPGMDNVDIDAATEKGIPVMFTPGANSDSVAEFTIALIFALAKRLHHAMPLVKGHQWRDPSCLGVEVGGRTAGIVGLGVIGFKVAQKLASLGMTVIASDPYVTAERAATAQARLVNLETLLRDSDIVSLHATLTDETRHMMGKREFSLMKDNAFLINTARGALVNEKALYEALRDGDIGGAAIDVFEIEPPQPDNPLLTLDNVILTPHIASWTSDALQKESGMVFDEVQRILRGDKPKNVSNPQVL